MDKATVAVAVHLQGYRATMYCSNTAIYCNIRCDQYISVFDQYTIAVAVEIFVVGHSILVLVRLPLKRVRDTCIKPSFSDPRSALALAGI